MQIHKKIPSGIICNPVVTIGMFDGLHKGHIHLLQILNNKARLLQGESVVITFWPHPAWVTKGIKNQPELLLSREQKIQHFRKTGIDHLIELPFTEDLAGLSASDFIKKILIGQLKALHMILGYNNRFGSDAVQDLGFYRELAIRYGMTVEKAPFFEVNHSKVSSTIIRNHIYNGDIWLANQYLGYEYAIKGNVIGGKKLGVKLGFPTANINHLHDYQIIPMDGVYAVRVRINEKEYKGVLNIGYNPTVDKNSIQKNIEVHIIDFQKDIYGSVIEVAFVKRIRDEMAFNSLAELSGQIEQDKKKAEEILTSQSS